MSLKKRPNKRYKCSCGRTFAHEISLKRHKFVAGCADQDETEIEAEEDSEEESKTVAVARRIADRVEEESDDATVPVAATVKVELGDVHEMFLTAQHKMTGSPFAQERPSLLRQAADQFSRLTLEFFQWLIESLPVAWEATSRTARAAVPVAVYAVRNAAIILLLVVGALLGHRAFASASPTPTQAPALVAPAHAASYPRHVNRPAAAPRAPEVVKKTVSAPGQVVENFYSEVGTGSYGTAYGRLSTDWKSELSFSRFEQGYRTTGQSRCQVLRTWNLGQGRMQVDFLLETSEAGQPVNYRGSHVMVETADGWALDSGNLSRS